MSEAGILTAIARRLDTALSPPAWRGHPVWVDDRALGYVDAPRRGRLAAFDDVFEARGDGLVVRRALATAPARTTALERVARTLSAEGALTAWRDERFAVATAFDAPAAFELERAAARYFGIRTYAAHANAEVVAPEGRRLWIARRSGTKAIDPLWLDNLVGGGIPAGEQPDTALVREAWEEAGIPAALAATARRAGTLYVERLTQHGLQREAIFAYDLGLPESFVPANQDGEAIGHRRVDRAAALALLANASGPDQVTVDASLVTLDWLARHALLPQGSAVDAILARARMSPP